MYGVFLEKGDEKITHISDTWGSDSFQALLCKGFLFNSTF